MFEMFKRNKKEDMPVKQGNKFKKINIRRFSGAGNTAIEKWNTSYERINNQLRSDYLKLTLRARDLAKNNEIVSSYINLMLRNVIGGTGFKLSVTAYNDDMSADKVANEIIQKHWYAYCKSYKHYVSADEQQSELDFDKMVLFNFLVDGEVFIRKIEDKKSPYKVRWEIIDSLDVDYLYNATDTDGNKVSLGIKVNEHGKPLSYFVRKNKSLDWYLQGQRQEVPANEIIHLYRKQYANQVRGFTPLAPVLHCLNGLEQYKKAEIQASLLNACYMGIWEKTNSSANAYADYEESEVDEKGDVALELQQSVFRYAPEGYSLKSIQSNHPNSNLESFFKSCIKGIASSLGVSSNKLNSDYESVNYSSLRQANSEDINAWIELQEFLIENWKNVQYAEWLKYLLISDLTNLPYSKIQKFLVHQFTGKRWQYLDPVKEYQSIQLRLNMGLSSPIQEIKNQGKDVDDVLNEWQIWKEKLKARGLSFESTNAILTNEQQDTKDQTEVDASPKDNNVQ